MSNHPPDGHQDDGRESTPRRILSLSAGPNRVSVYRGDRLHSYSLEGPSGVLSTRLRRFLVPVRLRRERALLGILPTGATRAAISLDGRTIHAHTEAGAWLALIPYGGGGSVAFLDGEGDVLENAEFSPDSRENALLGDRSLFNPLPRAQRVALNDSGGGAALRVELEDGIVVLARDRRDGRLTLIERYADAQAQSWTEPDERWGSSAEPGEGRLTYFGETPPRTTRAVVDGEARGVTVYASSVGWFAVAPVSGRAAVSFHDSMGRTLGSQSLPPARGTPWTESRAGPAAVFRTIAGESRVARIQLGDLELEFHRRREGLFLGLSLPSGAGTELPLSNCGTLAHELRVGGGRLFVGRLPVHAVGGTVTKLRGGPRPIQIVDGCWYAFLPPGGRPCVEFRGARSDILESLDIEATARSVLWEPVEREGVVTTRFGVAGGGWGGIAPGR